jgi:glyoxylase-like metal-dependent hydrolase (beta-lactamase superfamily II)
MSLRTETFERGPVDTNGYLVYDQESNDAVIIDAPPDFAEDVIAAAEARDLTPSALILTHTHWDHTGDVAALRRHYPEMIVYVHADDEYRLIEPMKYTVWQLPFTIEGSSADRHLHHGDTLTLGALCFEVIHTPGHTEGGICLYDRSRKVIFVGDTLFAGSVGRTDLPGGDTATLMSSIKSRLLPLPDDVRVLPGHGPATTIGRERRENAFLL